MVSPESEKRRGRTIRNLGSLSIFLITHWNPHWMTISNVSTGSVRKRANTPLRMRSSTFGCRILRWDLVTSLSGAVDRIESRLYAYLTEKPLSPVEDELDNLEDAALDAFEDEEYAPPVERGQLLRRQVARRCIYGVDINPLSTELARLSIWVHTFVPGLPVNVP